MTNDKRVHDREIETQTVFMDKVQGIQLPSRKYHIVTLGCQMNVHDSETLAGMLNQMGFEPVDTREEADLILYNTCAVRKNAENKALGNVIWLKELKKKNPNLIICVGGCMTQEPAMAQRIKKNYPFVDMVFGTHNLYRFPQLLYRVLTERSAVVEVLQVDGDIAEGLPIQRNNPYVAYITVMYGCNNFCSYCIVPYVRGRERSRSMKDILTEAKLLCDSGTKEIMLLGQNVNSYGGGGSEFAELLYKIDSLGIERIRFMTSHPKDISDELIAAYGELKHLCKQLHLPVQSGNDAILKAMNRGYSREHYLSLVEKMRKTCPDVGLTTDIIVGFPGETEQQFLDTMSLVEQVRYDSAFTFVYSQRPGTRAAKMQDDTPDAVKSERIQQLIALQQEISEQVCEAQVGRTEQVLIEGESSRSEGFVNGRTDRGHMVNIQGETSLIGQILPVKIQSAGRNTLRGKLV